MVAVTSDPHPDRGCHKAKPPCGWPENAPLPVCDFHKSAGLQGEKKASLSSELAKPQVYFGSGEILVPWFLRILVPRGGVSHGLGADELQASPAACWAAPAGFQELASCCHPHFGENLAGRRL